ncbi:alpha/beta hydrolase [Parafilimonas sp.]|uniref:alpha/beta hydrolase n=1 Tax=Parafilimonas sp. TaxID=1969739 RepID=UPI003F817EBA
MKYLIGIVVFTCCTSFLRAQYMVRIVVSSVATKPQDEIFIAGNFNDWNPADFKSKLKPFGGNRRVLVMNIDTGHYEFKFTRGNWDKVETTAKGDDIDNRIADVKGDTTINITIAGWKDAAPEKPKPNTASANVHVIDTAFFMPQLNRYRRIWIYLPPSYNKLKTNTYPVLYMQDGQNLFNEQTAFAGEWGIDETLDSMAKKGDKECIVVGIDNSSDKRMNEYNPYDDAKYGKGEGKQYIEFIATTLKPFIDKNYRTQKDARHTFIAGSSMGALISLYALVQYPDVFGGAGVLSPSFWLTPQLYTDVANVKWQKKFRIYLYAGEKESASIIRDMQKMYNILKGKNCCEMQDITFPLGQHNEKYWRQEFPDFYRWLLQ